MKVFQFIMIIGLFGFGIGCGSSSKFPQAEISNGLINARVYLPDSVKGYYQGARFDWSGVIPHLEYNGHSFFGKWFKKYDPKIHDAIMGPVNDFSPLGFEEAEPGGSFVKIGIGVLRKPDDSPYSFRYPYQILNYGKWEIERKPDQIVFNQKLDDKEYSYEYTKTLRLPTEKPIMLLEHSLKNTGNKRIETSVYNHNFFMIDKQPIGSEYITEFPFRVTDVKHGNSDLMKVEENKIIFLRDLEKNEEAYYSEINGFGNGAKDNKITIINQDSEAGVIIQGDRALSKIAFWSSYKTICPEPFVKIKIDPGQTFRWQISYTFFTTQNGE